MTTTFKPTPFNLSETELDALEHAFHGRCIQAIERDDTAAADAWREARDMLRTDRHESFVRRSTQRRERSAKLRQMAASA